MLLYSSKRTIYLDLIKSNSLSLQLVYHLVEEHLLNRLLTNYKRKAVTIIASSSNLLKLHQLQNEVNELVCLNAFVLVSSNAKSIIGTISDNMKSLCRRQVTNLPIQEKFKALL